MRYPIAEKFKSVQGEGQYAGTRMAFIRLAGCTVGKPYGPDRPLGLELYQEKCTLWDGRTFACDTNYRKAEAMTEEDIVNWTSDEPRICITGGEPLMHDLQPLARALTYGEMYIHLETSGSIMISEDVRWMVDWLAVSPKMGCLPEMLQKADEVKVLVDDGFDEGRFVKDIMPHTTPSKVWFQPVNELNSIDEHNLRKCLKLQETFKAARISSQAHKWWKVL